MLALVLTSFAVAALAAFAQATTGFGFALVAVPLLALVIEVPPAVVGVTLLSAILTLGASVRHRREADWVVAGKLTGAALVGMPLGLLALSWLDQRLLTLSVAVLVFLFAAASSYRVSLKGNIATTLGAGFLGGVFLTSTGMNGPPLVAVLQAMNFSPPRLRATLQASFSVQDLIAVLGFMVVGKLTGEALLVLTAGLPGIAIGWFAGDRIFRRLSPGLFRALVLITLLISASLLIIRALT